MAGCSPAIFIMILGPTPCNQPVNNDDNCQHQKDVDKAPNCFAKPEIAYEPADDQYYYY